MAQSRTSVMICDVSVPVFATDFLGIKICYSERC
jgi:hypothetical protein